MLQTVFKELGTSIAYMYDKCSDYSEQRGNLKITQSNYFVLAINKFHVITCL